jgi:serine/threonine protein kinase
MQGRQPGYFDRNVDYPVNFAAQPKVEFPPPDFDSCHRYNATIYAADGITEITPRILDSDDNLVPLPIIVPLVGAPCDDDDYYSSSDSESDDEDDEDMQTSDRTAPVPKQPSDYAYLLQRDLRQAIYGRVWQAEILERIPTSDGSVKWKITSERAAIKIMDHHQIMEEEGTSAERPLQEVSAMQHLQRFIANGYGAEYIESTRNMSTREKRQRAIQEMMEKHVMTALDVLSDDKNLYLVMPFCGNGELFDTLHRRTKFPEDEARFWFMQLLKGLETLQRAGVCHRDISLENTITTEDHVGLVIDYGMSFKIPYVVDENGRRQRCLVNRDRPCGKPYYISPEIRRNRAPFDGHAVDVWALGPLLFLMVCGFPPWETASSADERFEAFTTGQFAAIAQHWNLGLSPALVDLLQRMFRADPRRRLSLQQIQVHPWMNGPERRPPIDEE